MLKIDEAEESVSQRPCMLPSYDGLRLIIEGRSVKEYPL
jgi:hypothetical protein